MVYEIIQSSQLTPLEYYLADINSDGVWNPAEPFYDSGDGIFELLNTSAVGGNFNDLK